MSACRCWRRSAPRRIVASSYNEVSLLGFFANILVVPLLFVLIPLGIVAALLGNLWPLAGGGLFFIASLLLRVIVFVVRGVGESPWAYRAIPTPSVFGIICYYALVVAAAGVIKTRVEQGKSEASLVREEGV